MKKTLFLLIGLVILITNFLPVDFVETAGLNSAGDVVGKIAGDAGANTYTEPEQVIGLGINLALGLVGLIFLILMVYGGYLWMTAQGEDEQIKKAQKIIISTIIGMVIVLSAYAISNLVLSQFEG